jgi:peptidoglycan/xylan/chitin deacetylase (PgdA/CDA1 family)
MLSAAIVVTLFAAAGFMAWLVRGRSAQLLGPAVWRGPAHRRAIALTFDDGPSESTSKLLELLARHRARATFFVCGHHVRRLPHVAVRIAREGHELGNHSDTHEAFYLRSADFILQQLARTQQAVEEVIGLRPRLFRVPFGARWFGLREVQTRLGLTGVTWTHIARDWSLDGRAIAARLAGRAAPGVIFCFHDGRELMHNPDIHSTLQALELLLPQWAAAGYEFVTVSELLWNKTSNLPSA